VRRRRTIFKTVYRERCAYGTPYKLKGLTTKRGQRSTADEFKYDVFLSYNSKDKARVLELAERLRDAGLRVCASLPSPLEGEGRVRGALKHSRCLILCMSPLAFDSGWVAMERSTALFRDPSNEDRRFIPLLLSDCDIPATLARYKYVDFRKEAKSAFQERKSPSCSPSCSLSPGGRGPG